MLLSCSESCVHPCGSVAIQENPMHAEKTDYFGLGDPSNQTSEDSKGKLRLRGRLEPDFSDEVRNWRHDNPPDEVVDLTGVCRVTGKVLLGILRGEQYLSRANVRKHCRTKHVIGIGEFGVLTWAPCLLFHPQLLLFRVSQESGVTNYESLMLKRDVAFEVWIIIGDMWWWVLSNSV